MAAQAPLTVTAEKPVAIPPSDSRRTLRWVNATADDNGSVVRLSRSNDVTASTGIPVQPGQGETLLVPNSDIRQPLYFIAESGTSKIYWDEGN